VTKNVDVKVVAVEDCLALLGVGVAVIRYGDCAVLALEQPWIL